MPFSFHNWTEEYYRDIKRLQTLLGGKNFTSLYEKVAKMSNMAYNFVRLEHGILTDISSPPSPTFKYTLPRSKRFLARISQKQIPINHRLFSQFQIQSRFLQDAKSLQKLV